MEHCYMTSMVITQSQIVTMVDKCESEPFCENLVWNVIVSTLELANNLMEMSTDYSYIRKSFRRILFAIVHPNV